MTKLKFFQPYQNWTVGLLGRFERGDMVVQDADNIQFKFPNDYDDPSDIRGWTVTYKTATGSDFHYSAGVGGFSEAVSGKVGSVEVRDDVGNLVMTLSGVSGVDIGDIYPYIVNINDGHGPNPDSKTVMGYLVRGDDTFTGTGGNDSFGIHDEDEFVCARSAGQRVGARAAQEFIGGIYRRRRRRGAVQERERS